MERSQSITSQYECMLVEGSTTVFQHRPSSIPAFSASGGYWTAQIALPRLGDTMVVIKGSNITKGNRAVVELLGDPVMHVGYICTTSTSVMCRLSHIDLIEMSMFPILLCFSVRLATKKQRNKKCGCFNSILHDPFPFSINRQTIRATFSRV